ncbi:MAG: hypothetical protein J0M30_02025 [Chitinophagales bacterium]|nr:hypothetical protein [Chitinophagales bacterium]
MTDYIRNNKALVIILLILVLSNAALLFFLFAKRPVKKTGTEATSTQRGGGMREYMKKTLRDSIGFTDAQIAIYDTMGTRHKDLMKPLFATLQARKDSLYKLLMQPDVADAVRENYLDLIAQDQRNIDDRIFYHFSELRKICAPDQLPRFDSVIQGMIKKMIAGPPRRGGGNGQGPNRK